MKRKYKIVVIVLFLTLPIALLATKSEQSDPDATFYASTYGIPDEIAGFQVLAVKTSENSLCLGYDTRHVIVRSPIVDMGSFLTSGSTTAVHDALNKIDPNRNWQVGVVSAGSRENIISTIKEQNAMFARSGCIKFDVPVPEFTPTPGGVSPAWTSL